MKDSEIFIGIDVGTSGVRALAVDASGNILTEKAARMRGGLVVSDALHHEQDTAVWLKTLKKVLGELVDDLESSSSIDRIKALSIDSTSGTVVPVDENGRALSHAIMYNDARASKQAALLNKLGARHCAKMGYKFNASFALAKILWIKKNLPELYERTYKFLNAADFVACNLTGRFEHTDSSNVLKMGYDLVNFFWPAFLGSAGLDSSRMPIVVISGEPFGRVCSHACKEFGLPVSLDVIAGLTDGTAGFFASGAKVPGDFNTTIGSTIVIKGIAKHILVDALGRFYSHYHPDGWWLPGGAGNCGGKTLAAYFRTDELEVSEEAVKKIIPTSVLSYPLVGRGERLPFVKEDAEGFCEPEPEGKVTHMAALFEGLAFVERWIYELLEGLSVEVGDTIFSTGGCTRNSALNLIRASVLKKNIAIPSNTESAFGSAVMAASKVHFSSAAEAAGNMVKIKKTIKPDKKLVAQYEEKYSAWRALCRQKGLA